MSRVPLFPMIYTYTNTDKLHIFILIACISLDISIVNSHRLYTQYRGISKQFFFFFS